MNADETTRFTPRYGADGLLTAVLTDREGRLLMVAHMNEAALARTRETGLATFWSRSRQALWTKGETSGNGMRVLEMRVDCDQDCLQLIVEPLGDGLACHTGRPSCFYRRVEGNELIFDD